MLYRRNQEEVTQVSVGEGVPVLFLSAREPLNVSEVTSWRDSARLVMLRR